ncbi:hypothetical protein [Pseudobacteriovorax antillogorgiicola]|uniref:Lipoprotein n=1 Tax=Pseudobacteriovorax antillogorgiicola TaxID=1513793 RepID=A0A1Y6CR04_9BACT|nr:hypothetical protein [Pseudobacteriovorax antillogorgiicola]TCS42717.1 hypothetical protein EDD56_1414 [Pseudobacteriovorax antillogorgiicola]SMF82457.1 hypothetical protein SAMN06296036_14115 [Pseudobacteriovorax antillogorgiicola]
MKFLSLIAMFLLFTSCQKDSFSSQEHRVVGSADATKPVVTRTTPTRPTEQHGGLPGYQLDCSLVDHNQTTGEQLTLGCGLIGENFDERNPAFADDFTSYVLSISSGDPTITIFDLGNRPKLGHGFSISSPNEIDVDTFLAEAAINFVGYYANGNVLILNSLLANVISDTSRQTDQTPNTPN